MANNSNPCETRWSINRGYCCGDCLCTPTAIRLAPIHSPFGDTVYAVFTSTPAPISACTQALAVSEDRIPIWEEEFKGMLEVVANTLKVDIEQVTADDFIKYITDWLNLGEGSEQTRIIFSAVLDRLSDKYGGKGKLWFYFNDDTNLKWWDWVSYDNMMASRFDKTHVTHKYDRKVEVGQIMYERLGVTRHLIKSLGPCELYWTEAGVQGTSMCFFSPYKFLDIEGMPPPLRLKGTFSVSWTHQNNKPPNCPPGFKKNSNTGTCEESDEGVNEYAWNSGGDDDWQNWSKEDEEAEVECDGHYKEITYDEDGNEQISDTCKVEDVPTGDIMLPPQLTNVIIADPYNFCFTPKYIEFQWRRRDVICQTLDGKPCNDANGNLAGTWEYNGPVDVETGEPTADDYADQNNWLWTPVECNEYVKSYYEAWSSSGNVWGNTNALLPDVYFNCENPARWVDIKITDYPIQPEKDGEGNWIIEEKGWENQETCTTDEETLETTCVVTSRKLILGDKWACGDKSHLSESIKRDFRDNVWISTGRAADPTRNIKEEPDKATLVVPDAYAYNYKYDVSTHGLLVREAIPAYPPLPRYPDEVEKRNFQEELSERLGEIRLRHEAIALKLEEINMKIGVLQVQIDAEIRDKEAELAGSKSLLSQLQQIEEPTLTTQGEIEYLTARIPQLEKELKELKAGTPEINTFKEWRDELLQEDCTLNPVCVASHITTLEAQLKVTEADYESILRESNGLEIRDIKTGEVYRISDLEDLWAQWNEIEDKNSKEARDLVTKITDIEDAIQRAVRTRTRELRAELKQWKRESWKFMDEEAKVAAEIAALEADIEELETEFEVWKEAVGYPDITNSSTTGLDPEHPSIIRFGACGRDMCYFILYQREINKKKGEIQDLKDYIEDARKAKVLDPYIWQYNTYMWKYKVQEGMAYYKMPVEDTIDPDIEKAQKGWGKGRGIGHRTNWDFSWAIAHKAAGVKDGRHGIQTSRKSLGGSRCLIHYIDKGLVNQATSGDSQLASLEQRIEDIRARLFLVTPGSVEEALLRSEFNRLLNEYEDMKANPEDALWKLPHNSEYNEPIWEERIIPLSDYRPYGIVGRTVLNARGGAAPIPPITTVHNEDEISDWRKVNDPQLRGLYEVDAEKSTDTAIVYKAKEGTNLLYNLVEPGKVRGYNLVRDDKFKWQRKRYHQRPDGKYEEYWEDDPNFANVNHFLIWWDGANCIQKPYQPDTRTGGLLYKMNSQRYAPTLSQRSPVNSVDTNVESISIHNAYFINRRQAFSAIECDDGLLTITFFDYNYPINNPAPRGQVPFWYGDILFAPDTKDNGKVIQHRDLFVALKGNSGWVCQPDKSNPIIDELKNFHSFWWSDGNYYIKDFTRVGRIVPIKIKNSSGDVEDSFDIAWLPESIWQTQLGGDTPWKNMVRATVFTGKGAIISRTKTSGSTWTIQSILPNTIDPREVYPIGGLEAFNEQLEQLEAEYDRLFQEYERLWWLQVAGEDHESELLSLWDEMLAMCDKIIEFRGKESSPLVFFNMIRPTLDREVREVDDKIWDRKKQIDNIESQIKVIVGNAGSVGTDGYRELLRRRLDLQRQIEELEKTIAGHNKYNICLMLKSLRNEERYEQIKANIDYTTLIEKDKIKRLQLVDNTIFILTSKGRLFKGTIPFHNGDIAPDRFYLKSCNIQKPVLDFWMNNVTTGRLLFEDMYQTGLTVKITQENEDSYSVSYNFEEQRIDKSIEDEPYGGASCNVMLFDSYYDNPTALVNYKGSIWLLKDKRWEYTGKVQQGWMNATWNQEFNLQAECKEDVSEKGMLAGYDESADSAERYCPCFDPLDEVDEDLDAKDMPPHNLNYSSVVGDGTLTPEDLIGAEKVSDLDRIVEIIQSAGSYSSLADVKNYAHFGRNSKFFDNILRGLAVTERSLQFEYIESVRDLLMMELVYNKYFYVKSTRSLWEYTGAAWIEFLRFNTPLVKDEAEYGEMKCFLYSDGATGIPNREEVPPPDPPKACCRRCKEEREITIALDAIEANQLVPRSVQRIDEILGTSFGTGLGIDELIARLSEFIGEFRNIIGNPNHPSHPTNIVEEGVVVRTIQQQIDEVGLLIRQIVDFVMQGSVDLKKARYLLNFTSGLIRTKMIPLFGEIKELFDLLGEVERYKVRTAITFSGALGLYNKAYEICSSCIGGMMFNMSAGDFFVDPDPCKKPPKCEETDCECKCQPMVLYLGIINMYHKPQLDVRNSRMLNFFPSLTRDFIVHGNKWSSDQGKSWTEWNNCINYCNSCMADLSDRQTDLERIVLADNTDRLWESDMWVFEYKIDESKGGWTVRNAGAVWSDRNEWWYERWIVRVKKEWFDEFVQPLIEWSDASEDGLEQDDPMLNSTYRKLRLDYLTGNSTYEDGVYYLSMLGGLLEKDIRNNPLAVSMDRKDFIIRLSPPPNMMRDNTRRKREIRAEIQEIDRDINRRIAELAAATSPDRITFLEGEIEKLRKNKTGYQMFVDSIGDTELYNETYKFDILIIG